MARASASSTTCAMVILRCLRPWSSTADEISRGSFARRPPWLSIHTFTKSAPFATMSSTRARASSGVLSSEPGRNGGDMKRYFTVRIRAPRRSPARCLALNCGDVVGIERHAGRGGHAVERVLAKLRITRRRPDMAMAVDDARHDELAGEVDVGRAAGNASKAAARCLLMRPRSTTIVTSCCGAAPVPSISVAWSNTVTCACALPIGSNMAVRIAKMFVRIAPKLRWSARAQSINSGRGGLRPTRAQGSHDRSAALDALQFPRRHPAVDRARGKMRARQRQLRARPSSSSARMVSQVTSNSHHWWPCVAERGWAWWLLCQPSPLVMRPTKTVVAAVFVGLVVAVAPQVRHRIDRPGDVPDQHRPHEHAPDQHAQAELHAPPADAPVRQRRRRSRRAKNTQPTEPSG